MNPQPSGPPSPADARVPYLYIVGASYTGSTLLAFLLNSHSRMVSVSEVCGVLPSAKIDENAIESYWCSCGVLLLQCPFYRDLTRRIEGLGSSFDLRNWKTNFEFSRSPWVQRPLTRPLPQRSLQRGRDVLSPFVPGFERKRKEIATRNLHFAQATLAISGKQVFVDAQKDASRVRFLAGIPEFDLRVVHLIRDARAGTASYMKHDERCDAATGARRWLRANLTADWARSYLSPDRWKRIHYEDLCADYQSTVDEISTFAAVEPEPISENFGDSEHHIVGNKMRRGSGRGIRLDESWKQRLSEADLEAIRRVAGRANRRFGFDWP